MKVYQDVFSGEDIISDAYDFEYIFDNVGIKIKSKYITVGQDKIDIGCGDAFGGQDEEEKADDQAQKVLDVIDAFKYQETSFDKKGYMAYIKEYMKKVKEYLQEKKPDRVEAFTKGATEMVKWVLSKFADITFYTPESFDAENSIILSYYEEGDETPTFVYFFDGFKFVKY